MHCTVRACASRAVRAFRRTPTSALRRLADGVSTLHAMPTMPMRRRPSSAARRRGSAAECVGLVRVLAVLGSTF